MRRETILRRRLQFLTWQFIVRVVVSGITAIPLPTELDWLTHLCGVDLNACEKEMPAVVFHVTRSIDWYRRDQS